MKVLTPLSHLLLFSASVPARFTDHTHVLGRGRGGEAVRVSDSEWKRGGLAQACREINEGHVEGQHRPLAPSLPRGRLTDLCFPPLCLFLFLKLKRTSIILMFLCSVDPQKPRTEWVLSWPGQVVIAGCQVFWTTEVSEALAQGDLSSSLYPQLQTQVSTWDWSNIQTKSWPHNVLLVF